MYKLEDLIAFREALIELKGILQRNPLDVPCDSTGICGNLSILISQRKLDHKVYDLVKDLSRDWEFRSSDVDYPIRAPKHFKPHFTLSRSEYYYMQSANQNSLYKGRNLEMRKRLVNHLLIEVKKTIVGAYNAASIFKINPNTITYHK